MALTKRRRPRSSCIKRMRQTIGPETRVQIALIEWIKLQYPITANFIIKIDNEGRRSPMGHSLSIQSGLHIGASDLFIAYPCGGYHGLFLEIKREKWRLTPSQKEHVDRQLAFIDKMKSQGYQGQLGIGLVECMKIVKHYLEG
jgi:hypothetical protein